MNKIMRMHVFFSGQVQGVGFRFTSREIAAELSILGWVKNGKDGRVEIVAEQDEETLKRFLNRLQHAFSRYITDVAVTWEEATEEFDGFGVEFV